MEAVLSKTEIEAIAKIVSENLRARFIADGSQKELQTAAENYTKQMIGFYLKENEIAPDVAKMIKPILDEHLRQTNVVEEQLRSYMNTDHFKELELKNLKSRVAQIEKELYGDED